MSGYKVEDLQVATPVQIIEAWSAGAMNNTDGKAHAQSVIRAHPVPDDIDDPTFYTPVDGSVIWHRAREISNPSAMRDLKEYLFKQGLCLPAGVSEAWARIMEHDQWAQGMREALEVALALHTGSAPDRASLRGLVLEDLAINTEWMLA